MKDRGVGNARRKVGASCSGVGFGGREILPDHRDFLYPGKTDSSVNSGEGG